MKAQSNAPGGHGLLFAAIAGGLGAAALYLIWQRAGSDRIGASPSAPSADQPRLRALLATPLSPAESAELAAGPQLVLDPGVPESARAVMTDILRASMAIEFDSPVPVLGTRRVWDYIRQHVRTIRLSGDLGGAAADATWDTGEVRFSTASWFDGGALRGDMRRDGWEAMVTLAHEARHLAPGDPGHACSRDCSVCGTSLYRRSMGVDGGWANDESIAAGGATAATYYVLMWLAEHSGTWLSADQKERFRSYAQSVLATAVCDGRTPQMLRMPGEQ